ncbi:hypothetical protein J5226_05735 [Lysobacter sp. K5869]|uniref:hypothetical protein n=1 Tax=Lysobacter sp. K5869 TaxID=2820808 RepID=UPI001C062AFA|nr:hypothetical protein [Lysobacter sp. K5869]QWP77907.1 hypothetical protein J5226_05735 [Lysobacter sp. K5869]
MNVAGPPPSDRRFAIWFGLPVGMAVVFGALTYLVHSGYTQPFAELRWTLLQSVLILATPLLALFDALASGHWKRTLGACLLGVLVALPLGLAIGVAAVSMREAAATRARDAAKAEYHALAAAARSGDRAAIARTFASLRESTPVMALCDLARQQTRAGFRRRAEYSSGGFETPLPELMLAADVFAAGDTPPLQRQVGLTMVLNALQDRGGAQQLPTWLRAWRKTLADPAATRIGFAPLSAGEESAQGYDAWRCAAKSGGSLRLDLFRNWGTAALPPLREAGFRLTAEQQRQASDAANPAPMFAPARGSGETRQP